MQLLHLSTLAIFIFHLSQTSIDSHCFLLALLFSLKLTPEVIEKMSAPTQASKASQHPPLRQVGQSTAQPVPQDPNQFKIPEIPERTLLALTPSNLRKLQQARGRCAKASSQMPAKTTDSLESNASGFLEAKIEQLTEFRDYLELVKCGILEGNDQQPLSNEELQSHMAPVVTKLATTTATLQVLKSQKRHLAHDLEEETTAFRRQKTGRELQDLIERAYVQAIIDRVMRATAKQAATPFKAKRFKEDVNEIYGIIDRRPIRAYNWCHVLGIWRDAVMIKAARIVPKSLNIGELGHIFGDSNDVISDPLNGQFHLFLAAKVSYSHVVRLLAISLHKNIERHLDQGTIVIVPAPGDFTVPTKWRCLVLDRSKGMDIICLRTDVKDMDRTSGRGDQFVRVKVSLDIFNQPSMPSQYQQGFYSHLSGPT